jgi:hypothetical protein
MEKIFNLTKYLNTLIHDIYLFNYFKSCLIIKLK